ncbi:MAG: MFS transporter [Proteobacteria bacterium]|nr:MFS transporter [Pseudomonadota bacterium]MBU1710235.1 MFS transporter [Pseudomonadota bacterium]
MITEKKHTAPHLSVSDWRSYVTLFSENHQFRRLWLAGIISQMGNWFNYIAIFVLLTKLTGSGAAVSWFLIAKFIPTTILGPAAGVIADRFSRKMIMILSDLSRVAVVLCFLLVDKPEHVWLVYVLALIQESIWTFYDPARRATIPNLCRPEELNIANALGGATWSLMLAFGAGLGGLVTALLGWQTAIIIDSVTFLVSAGLLKGLVLPPLKKRPEKKLTWKDYTGLNDLHEGLKYVASDKKVAALLLVKSGWAISGGILVMLTVFGEEVFPTHGPGAGSGILYSIRGVGAALGPILAWRYLGETRNEMYRAIGLSFFVASGAYMLFGQAQSLLAAIPFVFIGHLGGSVQWVFSTNLLQRTVPDEFRGRVFAAEMGLLTLILSLSTYFTGAALGHGLDPRLVMMRLAMLFLLPGIIWSVYIWTNNPATRE